ncbi:MAG: FixH family protein [Thermodesulfovibrionales bacterium]|jgi:hypothetical protein
MKRLFLGVLVLLFSFGVVYAAGLEMTKKAGEYTVEVKIDRNPPVVGKNTLDIGIKGSEGKYVTDADVAVDYSMPAMPGMPPMNYKTKTSLNGDRYRATMDLSMAGPWNIAVKVKKGGKTSTARFSIDAQ